MSVCECICFCSEEVQLPAEELNMAETFRWCNHLHLCRQLHVELASLCWESGTPGKMVKPSEQWKG